MIRLLFIVCTVAFAKQADHLLLIRIVTQPTSGESFSIYNPTENSINLSNYYICDDEKYYEMETEGNMSPSNFIYGFTAQFPLGLSIEPYDTLTIVFNDKYTEFYLDNFIPDLVMYLGQENSMIETENGSFGAQNDENGDPKAKLSDTEESLFLFKWEPSSSIQIVDYFIWDTTPDNPNYFDVVANQNYAYSKIGTEETHENENFQESWTIIRFPDFTYGCTDLYAVNYNPLAEYEIDTYYEHNTELFKFNSSLSCRYSFEQILNNKFEIGYSNIKVYGRVVDFFDIRTVADSGPQNITIEDENGYRITITVWDWEVAASEISEVLTEYNKNMYYLWAKGNLDFYEKYEEWQVDVTSSDNIIIAQNYSSDGEYESSSTPMQTSINPEPFVLIPSLDETLDYNFTFPDKSRVIVRIFDISGRFITSLVDKYYISSGTVNCSNPPASWDGKDHLGQIVSPGTYIMHIEAMNPVTGETHTDAAPVVVGVKN